MAAVVRRWRCWLLGHPPVRPDADGRFAVRHPATCPRCGEVVSRVTLRW